MKIFALQAVISFLFIVAIYGQGFWFISNGGGGVCVALAVYLIRYYHVNQSTP